MQKKFEDIYIIRPTKVANLALGDNLFVYNATEGKSQYVTIEEIVRSDKGLYTYDMVTSSGNLTLHDSEVVYQALRLKTIVEAIGLLCVGIGASALLYNWIFFG